MDRLRRHNSLALTCVLLLAACAGTSPTSTSDPTKTVVPNSSPVASPTPSADPGPGGLEVGRIAEIVTTDLVVRSLPEISDASVIDPVRVPIGFLAYIVDGPSAADGYDWYQVAPFPPTLSDVVESYPQFGWLAAAGKDGERWIAPWEGGCPEPNWDGVKLSQPYVALACWGRADVTLEGILTRCVDQGVSVEPGWVFDMVCNLDGPSYGELLGGGLEFFPAPSVAAPVGERRRVRVTGHLDDPGAAMCRPELVEGPGAPPELVTLRCRLRFVVTEITEL